jgi:excisionase family DNA binding protein
LAIRKGFYAAKEVQADGKPSLMRMLTVQEVAAVLNVHPDTVRHWSDCGLLRTYRIGHRGDRRFWWEDIDIFLKDKGRSPSVGKLRKGKVLIVDDDYRVRDLLKDAVQEHGHEAISVDSGERALEELGKQDFDLIFLDLVLPGLSGVDVLRAMKVRDVRAIVAVITGHSDSPIALEAISLGPFVFIRKPFDVGDIIDVLDVTMGAKREVSGRFKGKSGGASGAGQREGQESNT